MAIFYVLMPLALFFSMLFFFVSFLPSSSLISSNFGGEPTTRIMWELAKIWGIFLLYKTVDNFALFRSNVCLCRFLYLNLDLKKVKRYFKCWSSLCAGQEGKVLELQLRAQHRLHQSWRCSLKRCLNTRSSNTVSEFTKVLNAKS